MRIARSASPSSPSRISAISSRSIPWRRRSLRIKESLLFLAARPRARASAKRASESRPAATSSSSASSHSSVGIPARPSRSSSSRRERSRWLSARSASSLALVMALLGGGLDLRLCFRGRVGGAVALRGREQPSGDDLVWPDLGLDLREDLLRHVGMLSKERGRVLASLAEPLLLEAEVRPRLLDRLPLQPGVEHRALPGDPLPVDDVELRLLERRRHLVLHDLDPDTVAHRLHAVLQRLDAADVESDGRVELERAAARGRLRVPEHDADLLPELVREDADRLRPVQRAGKLPQRLAHQASLEADVAVPHLALDLGARRQRGDGVHGDDGQCAAADQQLRDLERLLAVVRLRYQEVLDVDADPARVLRVHRVLGFDEGADAAAALSLGDHVVDERRLARALRAEYLDDAAAREPAAPGRGGSPPMPRATSSGSEPVEMAPICT